jgi:formiminotetrahydrofolate cyclodeaminase
MGAALVAKAAGVTIRRQDLEPADRAMLHTMAEQAQVQRRELARLAEADVEAYRALLDARAVGSGTSELQEAYLTATEVPFRVAEVCQALLDGMSGTLDVCWSAVRVDLEIGRCLLETGVQAGLLAAESNLHDCGSGEVSGKLQERLDAIAKAAARQVQRGGSSL